MALIGWTNAVDMPLVELAASSAAFGYDVANLRDPRGAPSIAWQTPAYTRDAFLTLNSPTPIAWRLAALCRTNLTTAARLRVRVGALATVISAPAYDSGLISAGVAVGIGQALHVMPVAVSATTMNIYVDDAANPDLCLNIPLAYAGSMQDVAIGPSSDTGLNVRRADTTSRGGTVTTQPLSWARQWEVRLPFLRDADIAWLDTLEAAAAVGRNVMFVPRETHARASSEAILGLLTPGRRGFLGSTGNNRSWSASINERI